MFCAGTMIVVDWCWTFEVAVLTFGMVVHGKLVELRLFPNQLKSLR